MCGYYNAEVSFNDIAMKYLRTTHRPDYAYDSLYNSQHSTILL